MTTQCTSTRSWSCKFHSSNAFAAGKSYGQSIACDSADGAEAFQVHHDANDRHESSKCARQMDVGNFVFGPRFLCHLLNSRDCVDCHFGYRREGSCLESWHYIHEMTIFKNELFSDVCVSVLNRSATTSVPMQLFWWLSQYSTCLSATQKTSNLRDANDSKLGCC